jgi:hypothetical protein
MAVSFSGIVSAAPNPTPSPYAGASPAPTLDDSNVPTLGTQQLTFTTQQLQFGSTQFYPSSTTVAGATAPPFAQFGAGFLQSVLPTTTQRVPSAASQAVPPTQALLTDVPPQQDGSQPSYVSPLQQSTFAAQYAPQIYAAFLGGYIDSTSVQSSAVTERFTTLQVSGSSGIQASAKASQPATTLAELSAPPGTPKLLGDPPPAVPGFPPVQPPAGAPAPVPAASPTPEGDAAAKVAAALSALAGSATLFGTAKAA